MCGSETVFIGIVSSIALRPASGTHPVARQQVDRQQLRRHADRVPRHRRGQGALQLQRSQHGVGAVRLGQLPPRPLRHRHLRLAGGVRHLDGRQARRVCAGGGGGGGVSVGRKEWWTLAGAETASAVAPAATPAAAAAAAAVAAPAPAQGDWR